MQILFGLETEYGIARDASDDVVTDAIAVVRSASDALGVRDRWGYHAEDPHVDARGFRARELKQDADEAQYLDQDAKRVLSFTELKSDIVLRNGARFYNDHTHPEYCTPECSTLLELLQQDRAGEALVIESARAAPGADRDPIRLYKNNTDLAGHAYGCHENYLIPRSLPWSELVEGMQAFLATRQIFCGAGKYGWEAEDRFLQPGFQISQRADFVQVLQSIETMRERPLINTRDEPHADTAKYRRFHVIVGDANMSPFSTYLKVGATALFMQALAARDPEVRLPQLADPVAAVASISRDPKWAWRVRLADGTESDAIAVQRACIGVVQKAAPPAGPEWQRLLQAWIEVLDDLERDPLSTADRVDWAAKYQLVERFRAAEGLEPEDPWLRSLDLAYHLLDRGAGLGYGLEDAGAFRLPYPRKELDLGDLVPPSTTRAVVRGGCVEKFASYIEHLSWSGLVLRGARGGRVQIDLRDVFSAEVIARSRDTLAAAQVPEDLLALPFAKKA